MGEICWKFQECQLHSLNLGKFSVHKHPKCLLINNFFQTLLLQKNQSNRNSTKVIESFPKF